MHRKKNNQQVPEQIVEEQNEVSSSTTNGIASENGIVDGSQGREEIAA